MYSAGVDGVRQRRRQRGQQEPVEAHGQQHADVERGLGPAGPDARTDQDREPDGQHRPGQVEDDQDLSPRPAVQHDADERAEDRERQQGDGQHGGHRRGVGLALRGEQHERGQRHLEHAVGGLGGHPHRQQPPEQPVPDQLPQATDELHADEVRRGRYWSPYFSRYASMVSFFIALPRASSWASSTMSMDCPSGEVPKPEIGACSRWMSDGGQPQREREVADRLVAQAGVDGDVLGDAGDEAGERRRVGDDLRAQALGHDRLDDVALVLGPVEVTVRQALALADEPQRLLARRW